MLNVFFRYPSNKITESLNLKFEKGDLIGISGISGKGKTTFANLLLGFLVPDTGTIFINGMITDATGRQAYWNKISYIKQQPFFIHDSLLKNIILQDNEYDKMKLAKVMAVTGVDKLVSGAANGSETMIYENGKNFSGGQRQRIIFARALYKDFDLLILDEPFNELDEPSEKIMLQYLEQLAGEGKIVVLITHNKGVFSFCNKKITMSGTGE